MRCSWTGPTPTSWGSRLKGSLPHLLCHTVLPYSNWQSATRCQSESLMSLRHGLQEGVQRLGKVMQELRVDNSSAPSSPALLKTAMASRAAASLNAA